MRTPKTRQQMHLMRITIIIATMLIPGRGLLAQAPDWQVNAGAYQYTMTIVAFLHVDNKLLVDEQDKVAAFVDGEIRGVASPLFVPSADRHLTYLTVFANKDNEKLEFRIYESSTDEIRDVSTTLNFKIDGQLGNVFQAFSVATPPLNDDAEIESFSFMGIKSISDEITDGRVDIALESHHPLSNLTPEFVLSTGAKMFIDRRRLTSGAEAFDLTEPIFYSVMSEDESILKTWEVRVGHDQMGEGEFTSSNVITANNDGSNDYWIVQNVSRYNRAAFKIFDADGRILFESTGYNNDWNGYYDGSRLARGTYYFTIKDADSNKVIRGDIILLY